MPSPPTLGTGALWRDRSLGRSSAKRRRAGRSSHATVPALTAAAQKHASESVTFATRTGQHVTKPGKRLSIVSVSGGSDGLDGTNGIVARSGRHTPCCHVRSRTRHCIRPRCTHCAGHLPRHSQPAHHGRICSERSGQRNHLQAADKRKAFARSGRRERCRRLRSGAGRFHDLRDAIGAAFQKTAWGSSDAWKSSVHWITAPAHWRRAHFTRRKANLPLGGSNRETENCAVLERISPCRWVTGPSSPRSSSLPGGCNIETVPVEPTTGWALARFLLRCPGVNIACRLEVERGRTLPCSRPQDRQDTDRLTHR